MNRQFLDPVFLGRYPEELAEAYGAAWPAHPPEDFALISQPLDFLGINYYFRTVVRADGKGGFVEAPPAGVERTQMGWEVYPQGLRDLLVDFKARYAKLPPIYITENGMASDDAVVDGQVADPQRIRFLERHLMAVNEAIEAGVDVRGYFVWSLMDNYEWSFGYERRFGITHVDYTTLARTLKHSAHALRAFLQERRKR
jgi:beta-glucosidase